MARPDLNLLFTLDVLLAEGNVARAARRLRLSPSAMSRALARLREATGDPLLVRAGRGMVASPRALELRDSIARLVQDAEAALRPADKFDLGQLDRTFTLRASEGFVENFGAALLARVAAEAPGARLHFLHKLDKDSGPLRDGTVDLETGVVDKAIGPEVRTQALFRDRYVGIVRAGHPLSKGEVTPLRFAEAAHVHVSRRDNDKGPIDNALSGLGLERRVAVIVVDLTLGRLLTRKGKFGKSRQVPTHPSTVEALRRYRRTLDVAGEPAEPEAAFFIGTRGQRHRLPLGDRQVHRVFVGLREQLDWRNRGNHHVPRIHDLRHSFVVRRITQWQTQGLDVDQAMLALSTYVGHAEVGNTYRYLSAAPELMAVAGDRFAAFAAHTEVPNA